MEFVVKVKINLNCSHSYILEEMEMKLNKMVRLMEIEEKQKPVNHNRIIQLARSHQKLVKQRNQILNGESV